MKELRLETWILRLVRCIFDNLYHFFIIIDIKVYKEYEYLLADIQAMISLPIFTDSMKQLLHNWLSITPSEYCPSEELSIPSPFDLRPILYTMPKNEKYLDIQWHGPSFFPKMEFSQFYYLLRCVLLEKSIVFISSSKNYLSAITNGFRLLLRPFKWCHIFIAILPKLLIDYMSAPQPMLLGITEKDEFIQDLDQDSLEDKVWVELDEINGMKFLNLIL